MKKYLPFILLGLGILVVIGAFFMLRSKKSISEDLGDDESQLQEVPAEKRPVVSLTPDGEGHYLKLKVDKIVIEADSMDYELLYQTKNGLTQGVPGIAKLTGVSFETDLLLGSESSGKFRYDEGVETGSVELKFRRNGKLVARFKTEFHMQTGVLELTSSDGKFKHQLSERDSEYFYVTMHIVGKADSSTKAFATKDDYGVFSSKDFVTVKTDSLDSDSSPVED